MRYLFYIFIIIVNFILQTTFFQDFAIFGIKPNTMIILIVSFSFIRGQVEGAIIGLFSGFLIDIFFSSVIGINSIIGLSTGYLSGHFNNDFYQQKTIIPVILTFIFTIFYEATFYIIKIFLQGYPNIFFFFIKIILPEAIYTSIVSIILYKALYYFNNILKKTDRSKRRFY